MTDPSKKDRTELQRLLSKKGIASRSQAAILIKKGTVSVNGKIVTDPLAYVSIKAKITIDGIEPPPNTAEKILIAFNKPKGVVTTTSDEKGRKTVYDVLPKEYHHLKPVGRLDMATTGLLLFTNDAILADYLLDPKNRIPRTYIVTVKGKPSSHSLDQLKKGISDGVDTLQAAAIEIRKASGKESILSLTLLEGKNREIRRMCESIGAPSH